MAAADDASRIEEVPGATRTASGLELEWYDKDRGVGTTHETRRYHISCSEKKSPSVVEEEDDIHTVTREASSRFWGTSDQVPGAATRVTQTLRLDS